jgi:RNA polymerase sigma-70 factor (ECF subfamily)
MTSPGQPISLEALAVDAQRGNHQAFRRLVERTKELAFSVSFRFLTNEEEARESAHESYIHLWNGLSQYDPQQRFTTWFYRIVTNTALDSLRKRSRWRRLFLRTAELVEEPMQPEDETDSLSNRELGEAIRGLTKHLPLKQRSVFVLRDLQELSTEETADVLGLRPEHVKANLYHARKRLRELLNRENGITENDV